MNIDNNRQNLPEFFRPLLWSYDFDALDPASHKKTIILSALNYGNMHHWRWITDRYGKEEIKNIVEAVSATEFKPRTGRLVETFFDAKLNYALRGTDKRSEKTVPRT